MNYTGISWEGGLIGPETLDNLNETSGLKGQSSKDFDLDIPVRDEIQSCWADAVQQWKIFKARIEREDPRDKFGTSRTRQFWIQPLLGMLGFDIESKPAEQFGEKSFAISHKATRRICPIHIVGYYESLDKAREGQKRSPHSMVQEFLNLSEENLYALVTNGHVLRLLRDSSRLVKLTYLEFDLEKIFEEDLYDNFAILYRLLHPTRFPAIGTEPADCLLEYYHLNSMENGSRIRENLSAAVKTAVETWANGFLNRDDNKNVVSGYGTLWTADSLNEEFLTLVYRLLFLLVIEERHLVFERDADPSKRNIYYAYYSLQSLRKRCTTIGPEEKYYYDAYEQLKTVFALFEDNDFGNTLGIKALMGDLFNKDEMKILKQVHINNWDFAEGVKLFDSYFDEDRKVKVRVNYAALNVEEFGSIYEGLLELDPSIERDISGSLKFSYVQGEDRDNSSSHYTPEELVDPLIKSALNPLIEKKLQEADKEHALLSIRVCDDACGSGHILLNAARRIALELARVRTKSDNPDPTSFRNAEKDVIRNCIYGIDKNPQAVKLCKVALWLESHNPGTSLGFLDNHIKCGDTLVGVARVEDIFKTIPSDTFKTYKDSDKKYYAELKKWNDNVIKKQKKAKESEAQDVFRKEIDSDIQSVIAEMAQVSKMDDSTPELAEEKKSNYLKVTSTPAWKKLKVLADMRLAGYFANKTQQQPLVTEDVYRKYLTGEKDIENDSEAIYAQQVSKQKGFFHWFLEFAEVMAEGGFDCFLGNPPFKGGQKLSGTFGDDYLAFLKIAYAPAGAIDLVGYFVRRNYDLLKNDCALGSLSTNTIAQGNCREGSLQVIEDVGGTITMAVKSTPWPGVAAVSVSLLAIYKGEWNGKRLLDGKKVNYISTFFDDSKNVIVFPLASSMEHSKRGSTVCGEGFILTEDDAQKFIEENKKNSNIVMPYINGVDLNSRYDQSPGRWVINFFDRPLNKENAPDDYEGEFAADYPNLLKILESTVKENSYQEERWWQFHRPGIDLYKKLPQYPRVIVTANTSKTLAFTFYNLDKKIVFDIALVVFLISEGFYLPIMQSAMHFYWVWKFASTMKGDLRYTPDTVFETFPFPAGFEPNREYVPEEILAAEDADEQIKQHKATLDALGEKLDNQRKAIMLKIKIGLTNLYNLYHQENLSATSIAKTAKCSDADAEWALGEFMKMRQVQVECDTAVAAAYGWSDIALNHGFYDLEFLPENDRRRYTVCPDARKEIMTRLLKLNNDRHKQELAAGLVDDTGKLLKKSLTPKPKKKPKDTESLALDL